MDSIWNSTVQLPTFPPQGRDLRTDVLVVGGGMTGILCSYFLSKAGVDHVLIEADRVARGVTGCTTAKITSQHGLKYGKLLDRLGRERAGMYLESQQEALNQYRTLCRHLDCDFQEKDSFVYSKHDRRKLDQELDALQALGFGAQFARNLPLPFPVAGAVHFPDQAQFHPLKFLACILPGLPVYERTKLIELMPGKVFTNRGSIRAEKIIIATHFPILNKHGSYFLKQYQSRSYVLALKHGPDVRGMYLDEADHGLSFRNFQDYLLLGGCGHRTGKQGGGWRELASLAQKYYPQSWEAARWATQDCMTLDEIPYIGPYSAGTPGLYVATGFGKWGMTGAMTAAMLLRDQMLDRKNPWEELFSPSRPMYLPQLASNGLAAVTNLLTPSRHRCPHMGCALKWNPQEHTWDCSCHGSRFDQSGKCLDNPATGDKKL